MKIIERNAASIDIGASSHFVAVPVDCDEQPVREFTSFTSDLHALADWLETCSVTTVAMESTGVYWIRLYDLLEERGIESFSSMLNTSKAFQDASSMSSIASGCSNYTPMACYDEAFARTLTS